MNLEPGTIVNIDEANYHRITDERDEDRENDGEQIVGLADGWELESFFTNDYVISEVDEDGDVVLNLVVGDYENAFFVVYPEVLIYPTKLVKV